MIDTLLIAVVVPLSPCGGSGYYDPQHGMCAPYEPANPPPYYHRWDADPGLPGGGLPGD